MIFNDTVDRVGIGTPSLRNSIFRCEKFNHPLSPPPSFPGPAGTSDKFPVAWDLHVQFGLLWMAASWRRQILDCESCTLCGYFWVRVCVRVVYLCVCVCVPLCVSQKWNDLPTKTLETVTNTEQKNLTFCSVWHTPPATQTHTNQCAYWYNSINGTLLAPSLSSLTLHFISNAHGQANQVNYRHGALVSDRSRLFLLIESATELDVKAKQVRGSCVLCQCSSIIEI